MSLETPIKRPREDNTADSRVLVKELPPTKKVVCIIRNAA